MPELTLIVLARKHGEPLLLNTTPTTSQNKITTTAASCIARIITLPTKKSGSHQTPTSRVPDIKATSTLHISSQYTPCVWHRQSRVCVTDAYVDKRQQRLRSSNVFLFPIITKTSDYTRKQYCIHWFSQAVSKIVVPREETCDDFCGKPTYILIHTGPPYRRL